ncbi:alpha-hydroxy-acid oxidizing protein [Nocardioides piscis]|uniref:alpha-hydroxy-acid oxidizing protein n=1 Tax=Nocardioides piscis TaxID=2714938 RepID=UPI001FE28DF7|nr:alpha-hydroxy-acid oxidizing protein [Nocardioides piscis]
MLHAFAHGQPLRLQHRHLLRGTRRAAAAVPLTQEKWEAAAAEVLEERLFDYVAGGAGDEQTQNANVEAFSRWGTVPRMLSGAAERDLSVELFGRRYPTPIFMAPIGVVGIMDAGGTVTWRSPARLPRPASRRSSPR